MNLNNVALAIQAQPFRPDRQCAQQCHAFDHLVTGQIRMLVDNVAALGVLIGRTPALDDLQRRPARAVEMVVEEREGQLFHFGFTILDL
jgi:hypothetical protein